MATQATSPLAALYVNDSIIKQLSYPSDLGSAKKGHWLSFTISVPTKSTYSRSTIGNATSAISNIGSLGPGLASTLINSIINSVSGIVTNNNGSGGNNAIINPMNGGSLWDWTVTPGSTKISTVISLYTPDTMSSVLHSHYSAESITEAAGALGQLAQGLPTIMNPSKETAGMMDAMRNMGTEAGISALTGSDTLVSAGLKAAGFAVNPQMEVFFKHIDFRTFQFDFLFTPRSASEAESVQAIIQAFKFHAAPEIDSGAASVSGRYLIVPSIFEIQAYQDGKPNDKIGKYGVCALETVNVDYAPQGWVTHDDGMPVQTRLTLQFKEMEILTKKKVEMGY